MNFKHKPCPAVSANEYDGDRAIQDRAIQGRRTYTFDSQSQIQSKETIRLDHSEEI